MGLIRRAYFFRAGYSLPILLLDFGLIHQHDRDVVFHQIHAVAPGAFEAFGSLTVFECLLAGRADQNLQ
jgi:hypothetical protein